MWKIKQGSIDWNAIKPALDKPISAAKRKKSKYDLDYLLDELITNKKSKILIEDDSFQQYIQNI